MLIKGIWHLASAPGQNLGDLQTQVLWLDCVNLPVPINWYHNILGLVRVMRRLLTISASICCVLKNKSNIISLMMISPVYSLSLFVVWSNIVMSLSKVSSSLYELFVCGAQYVLIYSYTILADQERPSMAFLI